MMPPLFSLENLYRQYLRCRRQKRNTYNALRLTLRPLPIPTIQHSQCRLTRNAFSDDFATNRHESCGLAAAE
jgi:hypothetical protein